MRFFARLLRAALDLGIRLGDAAGMRGPRWEWKKQVWRRELDARIAGWENLERGVRVPMRMCRECRTLVPKRERVCPSCGAGMFGVPSGGAGRLLSILFPGAHVVTSLLITINVGMSVLILLLWGTGGMGRSLFAIFSPPGVALYLFGEKFAPAILQNGEWWRLVTANYLHGGLLHLAMNCFALATLGQLVEEAFGPRKFFVIYTVCGVTAFVASTIFSPGAPAVGASGALFGLMGFGIVYGRFRGGSVGRLVADQLIRWLVYGAVMLFLPGIDNVAHFGGLVAGGLLGAVVSPGHPKTRAAEIVLRIAFVAAVLVTVASFVAMALSYGPNREALRQGGML